MKQFIIKNGYFKESICPVKISETGIGSVIETGGRYPEKFEYDAEKYEPIFLNAKAKIELYGKLKDAGLNPDDYIVNDTVHGAWKIKLNQGIVFNKKKEMAKKNFKNTGKLNFVIKKLSECEQEKHKNGYFLVSETWGTCFFRVAHNRPTFEIQRYSTPTAERTYTKIPVAAYKNVFHVYVNVHKYSFFTLNLPYNSIIVGMSDEQPSGDYLNYSFLVYSKNGDIPEIEGIYEQETQFMIKHENISEPVKFNIYNLCPISGRGKTGHIRRFEI